MSRHLGCQQQGSAACFAGVHHLLDQADAQGGLGVDALAAEDHAFGPAFADQPGQRLGTTGARQQTHGGFRQGHLRLAFGDADIAGQGTLQAAAHGVAVDCGNGYTAEIAQGFEGFTKAPRHLTSTGFVAIGEHVQVGASGEEFRPLAGHHQCIHLVVAVEMFDHLLEADQ